jgi:hypothetical protein
MSAGDFVANYGLNVSKGLGNPHYSGVAKDAGSVCVNVFRRLKKLVVTLFVRCNEVGWEWEARGRVHVTRYINVHPG